MSFQPAEITDEEILRDFPAGPLDRYRKQATFDWKQMKVYIDGEVLMRFKVSEHWIILLNHTLVCVMPSTI